MCVCVCACVRVCVRTCEVQGVERGRSGIDVGEEIFSASWSFKGLHYHSSQPLLP